MNELTQRIAAILNKQGKKGMGFKDLVRRLKIKSKHYKEVRRSLAELKKAGEVVEKKQRFITTAALGWIPAKITRVNKTFGFAKTIEDETEYFIPGKFLQGALPGDMVLIHGIPSRGSSPEGEVKHVAAYGTGEFIGKIGMDGHRYVIVPDTLMNAPMSIHYGDLRGAQVGDKVLARVVKRGQSHSEHKAEIIATYGDADNAFACAQAILELNNITAEFPMEVTDKAEYLQKRGIKSKDYENRLDLRQELIFTIDGAESKDLDDAISLTKLDDCWQLGVHIADVSHYVPYKSDIDNEAFFRGTSIYYANKVIPMLPPALSNGICSLNPNEDRLALSALLTLDLEGNLIDFDFKKSVIRSRVKGVYAEVNRILDGTADAGIRTKYHEVYDRILLMKELADIRTQMKINRGAPEIETRESKIVVDENEVAVDILPRTSGAAETLIEEFMLLANEAAAMAGKLKEVPFIYRIHEPPAPEKLENLNLTLRLLGLQQRDLSPNVKPKALAEILRKSKGTPVDSIVNMQVLRAMSKAKYSENPVGHYGLALENYAHFTSPIRRYPDLMVHRILTELIEGSALDEIRRKYTKYTIKAAQQSTQTELNAMKIERECEDCYKAEYMKSHLGETFDGVIAAAAPQGLYVELPNTVEGLLRTDDLPKGEYFFDQVMEYKNMTTGQTFRVGDPIRVVCVKCNVSNGNIDFTLPEE